MLKFVGHALLFATGWKCENSAPTSARYLVLAVPHTSLFDGFLMVWMNFASGLRGQWLVKNAAFRFPFRWILKKLGAVPVDRTRSNDIVNQVTEHFARNERFHLVIAPEGTRSLREHWKSGFYHMALQANVPIVLSYLDYSRKRGGFGPMFHLSGNIKADMDRIRAFYRSSWARYPDSMSPIRLRDEETDALEERDKEVADAHSERYARVGVG